MDNDPKSLVDKLREHNKAYRSGRPQITDREYDGLVETLRAMDPNNSFLHQVEPELLPNRQQIRHKAPMLSTEKAYTREALQRFVTRVENAASSIGETNIRFRVTPKLDGLAGNDVDGVLATRGDGRNGYDISHVFTRGLRAIGERNLGVGEIVIAKSYFEDNFTGIFDHPRNMVVGIVSADVINEHAKKALKDGQVHFVPYKTLPNWEGSGEDLVEKIADITTDLKVKVDYALDGMVAEATNERVKSHMGATNHHQRWQIAVKERGETATTTIKEIIWQTGRTGNVTPVLLVEPVRVSGATIGRVTAHHAGLVQEKKLGVGAKIQIVRSGEVIPKLEEVLEPASIVVLPENCPSCGYLLIWSNDFLRCKNHSSCPAQVVTGIRHWFKTLSTADWFGEKTIQRLVAGGHNSLEKIYALTKEDILSLDFGEGQTKNLLEALQTSRTQPVEDARFLAAFGIKDLGTGDSRKLLSHFKLEQLQSLDAATLADVKGFGAITSKSITTGITERWSTIQHMLDMGFQLERTPLSKEQAGIESPIAGKKILFTGKMIRGTRDEMKAGARALGAIVVTSISAKTDILVAGEKASSGKLNKARSNDVQILTEYAYLTLISQMAATE